MGALGRLENWHQPWCVVSGHHALAELSVELDRLGVSSPALLTSGSLLRESQVLEVVRDALGRRSALEFGHVLPHAPQDVVVTVSERVRETGADGLVAFGGGSAIDTAKGVVLELQDGPPLPLIVLPTTLSGSEYTNVVGNLDAARNVKVLRRDDAVVAKLVVLDPRLARATPAALWASTGMKCFSDAAEQLCAPRGHPVAKTLAAAALHRLARHLPAAVDGDDDARLQCYIGAWEALYVFASTESALGAAAVLRHRIGAVSGAGHAAIACALLPHVLRRSLAATPDAFPSFAAALGIQHLDPSGRSAGVEEVVETVESLLDGLGMPRRLRDLNIHADQVEQIVALTEGDFTGAGSPFPLTPETLRRVVDDAY